MVIIPICHVYKYHLCMISLPHPPRKVDRVMKPGLRQAHGYPKHSSKDSDASLIKITNMEKEIMTGAIWEKVIIC